MHKVTFGTWRKTYTFLIVSLIAGIAALVYFGKYTLVTKMFLSKVLIFNLIFFQIIPLKWWNRLWGLNRYEGFLLNSAIGLNINTLLLAINFFCVQETDVVAKKIEDVKISQDVLAGMYVEFELEDEFLKDFPEVRIFDIYEENKKMLEAKQLKYTIARSCLGYKTVKNIEAEL